MEEAKITFDIVDRAKVTKADYIFKLIVLGDLGVGKTKLTQYFNANLNNTSLSSSVNSNLIKDNRIDYTELNYLVNNEKFITLKVWDTSGEEAFNSLMSNLFNGADMILLMYDITSLESYEHLDKWYNIAIEKKESYSKLCLLGNKSESEEGRKVSSEMLDKYAKDKEIKIYGEISAITGKNISVLFCKIARELYNQIENCGLNYEENNLGGTSSSGDFNNSKSFQLIAQKSNNSKSCSC